MWTARSIVDFRLPIFDRRFGIGDHFRIRQFDSSSHRTLSIAEAGKRGSVDGPVDRERAQPPAFRPSPFVCFLPLVTRHCCWNCVTPRKWHGHPFGKLRAGSPRNPQKIERRATRRTVIQSPTKGLALPTFTAFRSWDLNLSCVTRHLFLLFSIIDIGRLSPAFPVTPPYVRVRIRRFGGWSYQRTVNRGIPSESK